MFVGALAELIRGCRRPEEPLALPFTRASWLTTAVEVEAKAEGRARRLLRGREGLTGRDMVMPRLEGLRNWER